MGTRWLIAFVIAACVRETVPSLRGAGGGRSGGRGGGCGMPDSRPLLLPTGAHVGVPRLLASEGFLFPPPLFLSRLRGGAAPPRIGVLGSPPPDDFQVTIECDRSIDR